MGIDFNNNRFNTTISNKLRDVTNIQSKIIEILNNDQQIKRYLFYQTRTPLINKGYTYDGEFIDQPDVEIDLFNNKIYDCSFLDELVTEASSFIFVSNYDNNLEEMLGDNIYKIDIFVPKVSNDLDDFEDVKGYTKKRHIEIAAKVIDLLDKRNLDDEKYHKAKVSGYGQERRFSSSSTEYKCYSFDIVVQTGAGNRCL